MEERVELVRRAFQLYAGGDGEQHAVAEVLTRGRGAGSGIEVEQTAGWVVAAPDRLATYVEVTTSAEGALAIARRREGLDT